MEKQKTYRNPSYLEFIRKKGCCLTFRPICEVHHQSITGKGVGVKCSDAEVIPLFFERHRELHTIGKESFAKKYDIDYVKLILEYNQEYLEYLITGLRYFCSIRNFKKAKILTVEFDGFLEECIRIKKALS